MNINNSGLAIFGAILAAGFLITGLIIGNVTYEIKAQDNAITVSGSYQQVISSDVVKWKSSFSRTVAEKDLPAGNRTIQADLEKVMKFMKDNGVADKDITVGVLNVQQNYKPFYSGGYVPEGDASQISGYTLTQNIEVQSTEVDKITAIAQKAGDIISQGVAFSSLPLEYYYSKLNDLKLDILSRATEDAKNRAGRIAESSGSRVGRLKSASMGVFQVTPVNSTDISDYGYYDTSSIEKQVTGIVKAAFVLD
jgi:hypothetical protein